MSKCGCEKRLSGLGVIRDCYNIPTERGKIEACFVISSAKDAESGIASFTHLNKRGGVISKNKDYMTPSEFKKIMSASRARKKSHYEDKKVELIDYME